MIWRIVSVLIAATPMACGPSESLPQAGLIYITAQPVAAERSFIAELRDDAQVVVKSISFAQGERVVSQMGSVPGEYTLSTPLGCERRLSLSPGVETDVILMHGNGACSLEYAGEHPPGQLGHVLGTASVTLVDRTARSDTTIAVVSLDDPPNPVPSPIGRDEDGNLHFPELIPGSYRFVAVEGDVVLGAQIVDIKPEPASNEVAIDIGQEP